MDGISDVFHSGRASDIGIGGAYTEIKTQFKTKDKNRFYKKIIISNLEIVLICK